MMFTDLAHAATQASWDASKRHPFIQQLQAGTLPGDTFRYYLIQDHYYLHEFGKLHDLAADQSQDPRVVKQLRAGAESLRQGEIAVRQTFFDRLNITPEEVANTTVAPHGLRLYQSSLPVIDDGGPSRCGGGIAPLLLAVRGDWSGISRYRVPRPHLSSLDRYLQCGRLYRFHEGPISPRQLRRHPRKHAPVVRHF